MLDSNTDRSYFMIGAVIVGAIIIAGAVLIFKDYIFAKDGYVHTLLENMFEKTDKEIGNINPGTIVPVIKGSLLSIFH